MESLNFFWYWIGTAAVLFIFEIVSPTFGALFAGVAALVTALLAYFLISNIYLQLVVFSVLTILSLFTVRPLFLKKFYSHQEMPSRMDDLIGKYGIVSEDIKNPEELGRVTIGGTDWSAQSNTPLTKGQRVKISSLDGLVLKVESDPQSTEN